MLAFYPFHPNCVYFLCVYILHFLLAFFSSWLFFLFYVYDVWRWCTFLLLCGLCCFLYIKKLKIRSHINTTCYMLNNIFVPFYPAFYYIFDSRHLLIVCHKFFVCAKKNYNLLNNQFSHSARLPSSEKGSRANVCVVCRAIIIKIGIMKRISNSGLCNGFHFPLIPLLRMLRYGL